MVHGSVWPAWGKAGPEMSWCSSSEMLSASLGCTEELSLKNTALSLLAETPVSPRRILAPHRGR